ncbi:MAG: LptA/OstA family protein [Verrucomicrobiota bacterium]
MDATDRRIFSGYGRRGIRAWTLSLVCLWALILPSPAQIPLTGRGKNFVAPVTDAQGRKSILRGKDVEPAGKGFVQISGMQAEMFRGQEKEMIVNAPKCLFDTKANVATSAGPLSIRTADDRFAIDGEGFHWQLGDSRLNSKLVISNRVQSVLRKRLIKLRATGSPTGTNVVVQAVAAGGTNDVIGVTANTFEHQGDRAVYRGQVRVHDPEGDLACEMLTVILSDSEKGLPQRIEAEQDLVLTQGTIRVLADKAVYTTGEDQETVEFIGHAVWQDGDRQGSGDRLIFDRRQRTLRAVDNAYLKVPRSVLGESGFLSGQATKPPAAVGQATNTFVEVFAQTIDIRLPETNGPIRQLTADRNVLIVDLEQQGRALADHAVYEESTGILELTGSPMVETARRVIIGKVIRFDRHTQVFTAAPEAYLKLPFQALLDLGIVSRSPTSGQAEAPVTNRFVEIWCDAFQYRTNVLHGEGKVRANFLEGDKALGKLTCATLDVAYRQQIESLDARTDVELEQFVAAAEGTRRKVNCDSIQLKFNEQGRLESADAGNQVVVEQEENHAGAALPTLTKLTSARVKAFFSTLTNRVERIEAHQDVVVAQDNRVARGEQAVYTDRTGLVELTGRPTATMPEGTINEADRLIWDRVHKRFIGSGKFKSEWKRVHGQTNRWSSP